MSDISSAKSMWMRGGTSKAAFFLTEDLPNNIEKRDKFLLQIMGSPDNRQIDGMGGADPLTSKVAMVKKSNRSGVDVDYLFLQVMVDKPIVSDGQNCDNILAAVAPFAIERVLIVAEDGQIDVTIYMENIGQIAIAKVMVKDKKVIYGGTAHIDGVPKTANEIPIIFKDTAGSSCGALLPTGNELDIIDDIAVTMIDNGMPIVILLASDLGISGNG